MNDSASSKRKRLTQACDCCRRMKVKCDTDKPACATCRRLNVTCTFLTGNKKRGPRQSSASLRYGSTGGSFSQTVMKFDGGKMVELIDNVPVQSESSNENTSNAITASSIEDLTSDASVAPTSEANLNATFLPPPRSSDSEPESEPYAPVSGHRISDILEPRGDNSVSENAYNLPSFRKDPVQNEENEIRLEEKVGSNPMNDIHLTLGSQEATGCENFEVRQLIDYYFEHIHRHYPFVHPQGFKEKFHENKVSPVLINSICALSSRYRASATGKAHDHSYAKGFESELLHIIDNPGLEFSQALLHMCIYELANGRTNRACTYSGITIRMVQGLGFFRLDETYISAMDLTVNQWVRKEAARRVWWFSYILDTYVGSSINRPPLINEDDCCVMLPCNDQYWEEYRPVNTLVCKFDKELSEQVVFMITAPNTGLLATHVALVTIMARATRGIIRFGTLTAAQKAFIFPQIKQALGAWEANLPAHYKYRPEETIKDDPSRFPQIAFLDTMRHSIDIWIHLPLFQRPISEQPIGSNTPDIAETIKRCFMSAKMITFAVQEVKSVSVTEIHPMFSTCIFMAAQFFLQGCRSQDTGQAQRSLKFFKFLHNTLKEWKVLWGVNGMHFSLLNECFTRLNAKRTPPTNGLLPDKYGSSPYKASDSEKSNGAAPWDSGFGLPEDPPSERNEIPNTCEVFGQSLCDTQEFNDIVAQILAQNQYQQFEESYDLHSKTLDEQYPSIWDSPAGLNLAPLPSDNPVSQSQQIALPHPGSISHVSVPSLIHPPPPTSYPPIDSLLPASSDSHPSSKSSESGQFGSS